MEGGREGGQMKSNNHLNRLWLAAPSLPPSLPPFLPSSLPPSLTLIGQVVDELAVFPVLSRQGLLQLEHRSVNLLGPVEFEYPFDRRKRLLTDQHALFSEIPRPFRQFWFP